MNSTILNVFPSQCGASRLVLASEESAAGNVQLVLRQESRSDHVGWFVQSRIPIEPDQVAALKMTLTSRLVEQSPRGEAQPQILSFQAARAG